VYKASKMKLSTLTTTFGALTLLMAFSSMPFAFAQEEDSVSLEEALQICNRVKNRKDRLDCFEGLATAAAPKTEAENKKEPSKVDDNNVGEIILVKPSAAPEESTSKDEPSPATGEGEGEAELDEERSSGGQRFVILTEDEAKERLDEKRTPRQKGENYVTNVRKAWRNNERKLMVLMTNGEIWKQIENGTPRMPRTGDEVKFKQTKFGGWFVKFPRHGRSLKMIIINP